MSLLEITDLRGGYGPSMVLHGISLSVDEGEIVVVLGANGAGKTTTMRAISGLISSKGAITLDGNGGAATLTDSAGNHSINAPVTLDANGVADSEEEDTAWASLPAKIKIALHPLQVAGEQVNDVTRTTKGTNTTYDIQLRQGTARRTLLFDTDGKIIWRADGSQWTPDEFVRRMKRG